MDSRVKILWLIKGLGSGGAERLLTTSIPYVDRNAFDYEVAYCLPHNNDLVPEFKSANIPVFCLDLKTSLDPRGPYRLFRLLRNRKPQILHIYLPYSGILGRVIGRLAGVRDIVYTECSVMEMYHPLTKLLNLLTYPLGRTTIAVSEEVQRSIMKHRIANRTELLVIPCGVDPNCGSTSGGHTDKTKEALGIPANHKVVGNVAHIRPEKGHEYLVRAAKIVLDRCPDVTFVIVGREYMNGEISRLEELAAGLGIRERVIFTGFRQDVFNIMRIFDLFVLSSLYEGLPLALLEAMFMGKPAVAPEVGGIPEVIKDGLTGFLVPPKNPEALAEKIIQILQDHVLHIKMSQNAYHVVQKRFSIQEMVRRVEQVYSTVLN
ncbi:glycosyltransferase [Chloroflexota bacterium]